MTRRKPSTPGPKPLAQGLKRSVVRTIKLTPAEASAQDALASKVGQTWTEMVREALELAIARGSTR